MARRVLTLVDVPGELLEPSTVTVTIPSEHHQALLAVLERARYDLDSGSGASYFLRQAVESAERWLADGIDYGHPSYVSVHEPPKALGGQ